MPIHWEKECLRAKSDSSVPTAASPAMSDVLGMVCQHSKEGAFREPAWLDSDSDTGRLGSSCLQ